MNDERPIEKLLRRYAKKRRDDAPDLSGLEMHPATRRMLQGEVARQFPRREAAGEGEGISFAQILKLWRRQLVWAVPVVIALGVGLWALVVTNEKPDAEFELAESAPAPATPAKAVEESFKALEADKAASPAPGASPANEPMLTFADRATPSKSSKAGGIPTTSMKDGFGVSLDEAAVPRKQSDATTITGLAATTQIEPELKLESSRIAPNDLAQLTPLNESREQTIVAKRAMAEPTGIRGDETAPTMSLALGKAKSDSPSGFYSTHWNVASEGQGRPAGVPAAPAPDSSPRYYRQEVRGTGARGTVQVFSQAFANRAAVRRYAKTAKAAPITPVLVNFQVEQSGNQLRVIDDDGSTYVGEVNAPAEPPVAKVEVEKKGGGTLNVPRDSQLATRQLAGGVSRESQNFAYRVAGTNRTLNQPVIFTWNFEALTNGLAAVQDTIPAGGGNIMNQVVPGQQFQSLLNNSVIYGRAQLGETKEIEINAVPVSR